MMEFDFVTIYVKDVEKSLYFYHEILGLEIQVKQVEGDFAMIFLGRENEPQIELIYEKEKAAAITYSGFSVGITVDSLEHAVKALEEKGYLVTRGPYSPSPQVRFSFVEDPNGVEIELIEHIN